MLLTESKLTEVLTEGLKYHLDTRTPLYENVYRPGSEAYFSTIKQARHLMNKGILTELCLEDTELLFETEVGEYGEFEGKRVPLDFPMITEAVVVTEPQTTEYTQAWNTAKQDETIRGIVEKEARKKSMEPYSAWLDMASKGKAAGGAAYTVGAASISQYLSEEDMNPDADVSKVMPILAEFMLEGNKKYVILAGQDTFREIQTENIDVWVVDLTIYQEDSKETIAEALSEYVDYEPKYFATWFRVLKDIVSKTEEDVHYYMKDLSAPAHKAAKYFLNFFEKNPGVREKLRNSMGMSEAKHQGREVKLNKPQRSSGPKKYKVYTKNDKGNVIVVNFGDAKGGLTAKINNAKARKAFSDRHNCPTKKDKTKAGYWSCRLPRYASLLGLKSSFGGYW
jgi:hypothetical protein